MHEDMKSVLMEVLPAENCYEHYDRNTAGLPRGSGNAELHPGGGTNVYDPARLQPSHLYQLDHRGKIPYIVYYVCTIR